MKKAFSLLLVLVLLVSLLPTASLASESEEREENQWNGRSAVFVGDSITAGSGTTKIYFQFLSQTLGFGSVTAMGVPGSCISAASDYGQGNQPLINRYQNISSADLIVIFMGTNDYGHETPVGSVEDTQDGSFYGALNVIIPALVEKHPSSKIVFVTPLHRYGFGTSKILGTQFTSDGIPNGVGATLGDYVEALKTVCANNGVSVIDLYTECTLDPADSVDRSNYMPDGLHPNAAGHALIAGIMESHIRGYFPAEETELVYGNRFSSGFNQQNWASSRVNKYLKAGTIITLKDPATFQWACAMSSGENSNTNLGYFPDGGWSDQETAVLETDGWVGFVFKYWDETQSFDLTKPLSDYITIEAPEVVDAAKAPSCTDTGLTEGSHYATCGEIRVMQEAVAATGHTYENGVCTACGDIHVEWEIGTIAAASGQNASSTTRLRTVDYLVLADYTGISINSDYMITYLVYDADKNYLGNGSETLKGNWLGDGVGISFENVLMLYPDAVYFRVALCASNGSALTLEDAEASGVRFTAPEVVDSFWESGTISAATGQNSANTTRLRTADHLLLADYSGVTLNSGYAVTWFAYDENKNYLGNGTETLTANWLGGGMGFTTESILAWYPGAVYFRIAMRAVSASELTLEHVAASGIKFHAPGESVPLPESNLKQEYVMSMKACQDGATYDGKVFLMNSSGGCTVYSIADKSAAGSFTLDRTGVIKPHANSVCFSDTFYAEGDAYPLLYVNVYNTYSGAENRMEGTCCVYRIVETDGVFTSELVQVIRIGFTEDLSLWKSLENNGDVRPYGNFVVDTDNDALYAFTMRDADKQTRFFAFNLPDLDSGAYSETYGCNVVTLEETDIQTMFDIEYFSYMQGACYRNGKILSLEGFGSGSAAKPVLRVINLRTRSVERSYDLSLAGLTNEPEMISYDPENGILYFAAADSILRKLTLSDYAPYEGKVISVLGDSISTFAGYIPTADGYNMEHLARYPQDNLLTDVNETWWMQVIHRLDARLGINDSWRGATVSGAKPVTTGTTGENACMANLTRIQNLGSNGTPDVILFYGGTNDLAHVSEVGSFDPDTAPTCVDLTTRKWDNLADGYVNTILRLQYYYPDAQIVCLLPTYTTSYYSDDKLAQGNKVLAAICEHYGLTYTDLRECGITTNDLPDGIHPDATGMDFITDAVLSILAEHCNIEPGENKVYSVTHNLSNVSASLGHYKGISAGESFEESIVGDDIKVSVTMDGVDITDTCYMDGKISIGAVSGDIVVTAASKFSLGDRLQQLPDSYYGVNLWPILRHDADYYTVNGWGEHSSGKVRSVTIPVTEGERLYASSFGAATNNGGEVNGIRVTFFSENGVLISLSAAEVYTESSQKGYICVPANASAVSIPMWTDDSDWELYIWENSDTNHGIHTEYLQTLPDTFCRKTNLWHVLEHDQKYYTANGWDTHAAGKVRSITIPINPGDQLWATSFQASGANGGTINGIRLTWFGATDVLDSVAADQVYAEFVNQGYLTAPENVVAVNVVLWNNSDDNEIYILNRDHTYENGMCIICGEISAQAGETATLTDDMTVAEMTVPAGVILDLNGYKLTVDSLVSFGDIIDTVGTGSLCVSDIVLTDNSYLPIYDSANGAYKFYEYELTNLGARAQGSSVAVFGFAIDFASADAYSLLASTQDHRLDITTTLAWKGNEMPFALDTALIASYASMQVKCPDLTAAMLLTVTGIDTLESGTQLTVTSSFTAVSGQLGKKADPMTYTAT